MAINTIIFDLGNVLIDWNPKYVFDKLFDDEQRKKYFFENICTMEWNEAQDAGRSIKEATEELITEYPDWKEYIESNPEILFGKPVFKGTRIPVDLILEKLSYGESWEDLLLAYHRLNRVAIQAALAYATDSVRNDIIYSNPE